MSPMTADDCEMEDYSDFDASVSEESAVWRVLSFCFKAVALLLCIFGWVSLYQSCKTWARMERLAVISEECRDTSKALCAKIQETCESACKAARFTELNFVGADGNTVRRKVECASGQLWFVADSNGVWHVRMGE